MEVLKPLDQVIQPDVRHSYFGFQDKNGMQRPKELADLHEEVSSIVLNSSVPEKIRSHFAQALNLSLYSWFHYQFIVTADFMSMVTIELALRERLTAKKNDTFRKLIKRAINEGLIKDKGFALVRTKEDDSMSYVEILLEVLPAMRNGYAHGTSMLHHDSFTPLRIAADFINQLFPEKS